MNEYLADIKKYDANPDEAAVERLVQRLALVMRDRDASMVATSDMEELKRVEKNWAQDKLGFDEVQSKSAVKTVAELLKGDRTKNRVTFYYLVAKELGAIDKI